MKKEEKDEITLKWGSLKAWNIHSKKALVILKKYFKLGVSMSAIMQRDTPRQKQLLLELIDVSTADKIYLDWEGKDVSKAEAMLYIMTYGK